MSLSLCRHAARRWFVCDEVHLPGFNRAKRPDCRLPVESRPPIGHLVLRRTAYAITVTHVRPPYPQKDTPPRGRGLPALTAAIGQKPTWWLQQEANSCHLNVLGYFVQMIVPSATTATPYVHMWISSCQVSAQTSQFFRVAIFKMTNLTERNLFHS